jgi:hypothetical protein
MKIKINRQYIFLTEMMVVIALLAIFFTVLTYFFSHNMKICSSTTKQLMINQQIYVLKREFRKFISKCQPEDLKTTDKGRTLTCGTKSVKSCNGSIVYKSMGSLIRSYPLPSSIGITFNIEQDITPFAVMNIRNRELSQAEEIRITAVPEEKQ